MTINGIDNLGTALLVIVVTLPWFLPLLNVKVRRSLVTWVARYRLDRLARRQPAPESDGPTVSGVYIYPVKSLRAVSLKQAALDSLGFVGDRRFMLVSPCPPPLFGSFHHSKKSHRFITQRQCPSLATIEASLDENQLTLTSDLATPTKITVNISAENLDSNPIFHASIWDDIVEVKDVGDDAADFLQSVVGNDDQVVVGIRLVALESPKPVDDRYVPAAARSLTGDTPQAALTDGYPLLIACESSLEELNSKLVAKNKEPIPMSRFRPNIVIKRTCPFEEDTWKAIKIGDTILHVVKGCPRCKQSCTDQETGKVGDEPLATLADFRALGRSKADVYFAQNAVAQSGEGKTISVGDSVTVLTKGDPVWDMDTVKAE